MSKKSVTILELHLGDGDINLGPLAVTGGFDETDETDEADETESKDGDEAKSGCGCSAKSVGGLLLALGALVAVAIGVAKLFGGDDDADLGT